MVLIGHDNRAEAEASAAILRGMGAAARRLLAESVERTGVRRKQLSAAAKSLESAGFLFVRDQGTIWDDEFELLPSLMGEEALEVLDEMEQKQARPLAKAEKSE